MPVNVEIKARAPKAGRLERIARELSGSAGETIEQVDTFFPAARGRLKLRRLAEDRGELIAYERPDAARPRASSYEVVRTDRPDALRELLEAALGASGVVRKRRRLFLVGRTRIHLDTVEGLGSFVELEVVLEPGEPREEGEAVARDLMERLGIREEDLVGGAYVDLLGGR